ncbi:hypothetical protein QYS48_19475 [Marivirga arenosa]|uniref:Uncharacterized protein n=1 Tax=Marivirga arenosa TaxID=3059076 RepID=A0AA49JHZ9_9BACT|nr:hypothetical protein [Marivirga sp. ABR2-2]WKK84341.1 hypothetical protein QYS48_19475 [Marivirga sp. ABR2-2]
MNKLFAFIFISSVLLACSAPETVEYQSPSIEVEGEFLFEGPNTLQGKASEDILAQIASQNEITEENIKSIKLKSATISFFPDSLRTDVESALIQLVSDDLELISVATKSPLPQEEVISLEVTAEQDILPYLKDDSYTLVVDANISSDMDYLSAKVSFEFNVEYKK